MKLVEDVYVSSFTKNTLEQFGWKEGDPIPEELGALLIKLKETCPPSDKTDRLIDREVLPAANVDEVLALLAKAKEVSAANKKRQEIESAAAKVAPGVQDAYKELLSSGPEIVDDRDTAAQQPPADDPPPTVQEEKTPEEKPADDTTIEDVVKEVVAQDSPATGYCPRCSWNLSMKFDVTPTERDKEDFLATLLGETRFKKTYELFGGKFSVVFRSLYAEENKMVYHQLVLDQNNGRVATEAEWFTQMMDYRLACSIEAILDKDKKPLHVFPELNTSAEETTNSDSTPIPAQLDRINKTLAQEVTRRLVGTHLRQFQRLVEALEAMALEPNFWTGIA